MITKSNTIFTLAFLAARASAFLADEDTFNYGVTVGNNYGPKDWEKVACTDHRTCPGWPDNWEKLNDFIPYQEAENQCKDCDATEQIFGHRSPECRKHKQSPIHLDRTITYDRECKDRHLMAFLRGSCGFGRMKMTMERHGLRAYQPMNPDGSVDCAEPANIDFSMGFPEPWHLVYTDFKVPSEHMMDGKRYDAEIVLAHIYSVDKPNKHIGKVAVMLEAGDESDFYDFLDLYIRRFRKERRLVKEACKAGIATNSTSPQPGRRSLLRSTYPASFQNLTDEVELMEQRELTSKPRNQQVFRRSFHVYDWLKKVDTEYYFRYEGSQGVPPCLEEVHWRVMKDPIRVAPSQIAWLERLTANRIDPTTCEPSTAGRRRDPSDENNITVDVNRPIQSTTNSHKLVFCECVDWPSRRKRDQEWCKLPISERGVFHYKKSNITNTPTPAP